MTATLPKAARGVRRRHEASLDPSLLDGVILTLTDNGRARSERAPATRP